MHISSSDEQRQTFNHWHSNCLLSKITKGEQDDLSSNNKHISDAWQAMVSSGDKEPPEFTVSNVDSCRRESLPLTDVVPATFSIKVLSKKRCQFSLWRLIQPKHQLSLTPKGATTTTIMYAVEAVVGFF